MPATVHKTLTEKLPLTMDFTAPLAAISDVELLVSITSISSGDAVVSEQAISSDSKKVTFKLAGGSKGIYNVEVIVVTTNGYILEGDGPLKITDRD